MSIIREGSLDLLKSTAFKAIKKGKGLSPGWWRGGGVNKTLTLVKKNQRLNIS